MLLPSPQMHHFAYFHNAIGQLPIWLTKILTRTCSCRPQQRDGGELCRDLGRWQQLQLGGVVPGTPPGQVWSLSSFKVSRQLLTNDLNHVSSVSLLMTASTALANKGLFLADLAPFVDTGRLIVISRNYHGTRM